MTKPSHDLALSPLPQTVEQATVDRIVELLRHAGADHAIAVMWAQRQQPEMERRLLADSSSQEAEARTAIDALIARIQELEATVAEQAQTLKRLGA